MGEPFHNIDNVIKASAIMVDEQGLHFSPRKVTVSTSGLVPQLKRFLQESNCSLAVSLNATTDEVVIILFFFFFFALGRPSAGGTHMSQVWERIVSLFCKLTCFAG
jgi:hypothetical protein